MVRKPMRGRRRIEMLEDLYENNCYEVLRGQQRTEVHGEKAQGRKCYKPAVQQRAKEEEFVIRLPCHNQSSCKEGICSIVRRFDSPKVR